MNEIHQLYSIARARTDAAASVDAAHTLFLSRLGVLNALESDGTTAPAAAATERARLVDSHRTMLRTVAEAPEKQLQGILFPAAKTPEATRADLAQGTVEQARNSGVVLTSLVAGVVEAAPRSKLTAQLRSAISDLRAEISAYLRSDVESFAQA